jgi:hypothetical protein
MDLAQKYPFIKKLKAYREYIEKWNEDILEIERLIDNNEVEKAKEIAKKYNFSKRVQKSF